jgi:hypothetical protein
MDGKRPQYGWLRFGALRFQEYAFIYINSGTHQLDTQNNFSVFPNPTHSKINIQSSSDLSSKEHISISIINSIGNSIEEFELNEQSISKDVRDYPAGLYFIIIRDEGVVLETLRVIVE